MSDAFNRSERKCKGCGEPLPAEHASYENVRYGRISAYCERCAPIMKFKEDWQPMNGHVTLHAAYKVGPDGKTTKIG